MKLSFTQFKLVAERWVAGKGKKEKRDENEWVRKTVEIEHVLLTTTGGF